MSLELRKKSDNFKYRFKIYIQQDPLRIFTALMASNLVILLVSGDLLMRILLAVFIYMVIEFSVNIRLIFAASFVLFLLALAAMLAGLDAAAQSLSTLMMQIMLAGIVILAARHLLAKLKLIPHHQVLEP